MKRSRKRDYKTEYARRIARAAKLGYSKSVARGHAKKGEKSLAQIKEEKRQLEREIHADAKRVFGGEKKVPYREVGDKLPIDYEIKLARKQVRDGRFEWTDEATFVDTLTALGLTEREAYTLWYSP